MTDTLSQSDQTDAAIDPVLSPRPDLTVAPEDASDDRAPVTARVERRLREGRAWAEDRSQRVSESIRAHPMRSGLAAVGVGVLMGMMLRR